MGFFDNADFDLADIMFTIDYANTECLIDELVALEDPNDFESQERIFNKYGYSLYTMNSIDRKYYEYRVNERLQNPY